MAKPAHITAEYVRSRFDYDPLTGELRWRALERGSFFDARWNGRYAGTVAGHRNKVGYVVITLNKQFKTLAHRVIWLHVHGAWPTRLIDHKDGVRWNNRLDNLREATTAQNGWNQAKRKRNTSGSKCVFWDKSRRRWQVMIMANCVLHNLGRFRSRVDAIAAYQEAALRIHGEFANLD